MQKLSKNAHGFGLIGILLIVLALGAVGFGGYNVYNKQQSNASADAAKATPVAATAKTSSDLAAYENKDLGFKLSYPTSWKIETSTPSGCHGLADDYGANDCPLTATLSPQSYLDARTKKYGNADSPLLTFFAFTGSSKTVADMFTQYKSEFASDDNTTPTPSSLVSYHGFQGFYVNQKTNSYSDNTYVIALSHGTYLMFNNRESDTHYAPGATTVDDSNDNTQYTAAVKTIVESISPLN